MRALRFIGIAAAATTISAAAPQSSGPTHFVLDPGAHVIEVPLAISPTCMTVQFAGSPDITVTRLLTPELVDYQFPPGHTTPRIATNFMRENPLPGWSSAATIHVQNNGDSPRHLMVSSHSGCSFAR